MRYVSTRGEAPALDFVEVMLAGLARDGGLYVPEAWPSLDAASAAAAALACAGSEADRAGLLVDLDCGRPPRPALIATAAARELEEILESLLLDAVLRREQPEVRDGTAPSAFPASATIRKSANREG